MNKRTDRTLGQMVKAKLYRQSYTQKHSHTPSQKEEEEKNIYHCSRSLLRQFGMIRFLFRYSTNAGYIKLILEISSAAPEAAGRDFPFSSFFSQLLGFSFGFCPASACRSPNGVCSCPDRTGLKERLIRASGSLRPTEGRGMECGANLQRQRPAWRCTSLRRTMCSPGKVVPGLRDPGSGGLLRLPGGEVWLVTCACTQASWWLQQQP